MGTFGLSATKGLAALVGVLAVVTVGLVVFPFIDLGPVSSHMALHLASMSIAAPLVAVALQGRRAAYNTEKLAAGGLWLATVCQMGLLWASHSPTLHHMAHASPIVLAILQAVLFLSALAFWILIIDAATSRWHAMLALLVTGKLACLLGVLLIFAPRLLFVGPAAAHASHAVTLADQHLAGLLMIAACPLSYVSAAVVLAVQAVSDLDKTRAHFAPNARMAGPSR